MLMNPVPISEVEMLLSWGRAEIPTDRFRQMNPPHLAKIEAGAELDAAEKSEVAAFMRHFRGPQVEFFLDGRAAWYRGEVSVQELGAVTLDAYWIGTALGCGSEPKWREPPPLTLSELAVHPDAPPLTIDGEFVFEKARGTVIAVSSSVDGALQLIEGSNRSRGMWRAVCDGKPTPKTVGIIVGVHPDAENYKDREAWLALAKVGWRKDGEAVVARCVDAHEPMRSHVLVCPTTRLAAAVSDSTVDALRRLGVP
jgi:hypothetical protein